MPGKIYLIFTLLFSILFSSCSQIEYISMQIKVPAERTLPNFKNSKVLVVDNTPFTCKLQNYQQINGKQKYQSDYTCDSLGIIFKNEFANVLKDEGFSDDVMYKISTSYSPLYPYGSSLPKDSIQRIGYDSGANLIISLDSIGVNTVVGIEPQTNQLLDGEYLMADVGFKLNIFDSFGNRVTPAITNRDSLVWDMNSETQNMKVSEYKKNFTEVMKGAVKVIAQNMANTFVPQWQDETRWYYISGNDQMKEATELAKQLKWMEAAKKWGEIFQTETDMRKLSRIASNIALANEMNDDIDNALKWIKIALESSSESVISDKQRLIDYQKELEDRALQFKALDKENQ